MAQKVLIKNGIVVDGSGVKARPADVYIVGDTIAAVGRNVPRAADVVVDAGGKVVAPGFVDTHSHADGGLLESPDAETQIRQGITTSLVGQDGGSHLPLGSWFREVAAKRTAINIGSFVGHGTVRGKVMGDDYKRKSTPDETRKMQGLVAAEMRAGALGLSSGLEYEPGLYADTAEIIALAQVAGKMGGIYISHVRDEEEGAFDSFRELVKIAKAGRLPAQISHIKLASAPVWNRAREVFALMNDARREGVDISADVYPYTYWQSIIIVLMPPEYAMRGKATPPNWDDKPGWKKALAEIGGAENVLVTGYKPNPAWQGKTVAALAAQEKTDPVTLIQDMVTRTEGAVGVVVTAMQESDLRAFIADPRIMFCTDGGLHGTHPRGAGSYPRVLGKYVREDKVLTIEEAIRKMSSLPAKRMGFVNRGTIAVGKKADVVIFDPRTVHDTATTASPEAKPVGIPDVFVNGVAVLRNGRMTGERPGQIVRRG